LGQEQSILVPLLGFNLGVEIAQIFVVCLILTVMWLLLQQFKINQKWVLWIIISMILLFSVPMVIERIP
jgi:cytochrome bd-type quinol oxidase subunit 1